MLIYTNAFMPAYTILFIAAQALCRSASVDGLDLSRWSNRGQLASWRLRIPKVWQSVLSRTSFTLLPRASQHSKIPSDGHCVPWHWMVRISRTGTGEICHCPILVTGWMADWILSTTTQAVSEQIAMESGEVIVKTRQYLPSSVAR